MKKIAYFLMGFFVTCALAFVSYNYFAPGGALSCTGNCTQQSVNLTNPSFLTGPLPASLVGAAGSNNQVQYNSAGTLGASSAFAWNDATQTLTLGNGIGGIGNFIILQPLTQTSSSRTTLIIKGAPAFATNGAGGFLSLIGADGIGSGTGGALNLFAGNGNTVNGTGNGGDILFQGGNGGAVSGNGGPLQFSAGDGNGTSSGGYMFFTTGSAAGTDGDGGAYTISTGSGGSNTGNGGSFGATLGAGVSGGSFSFQTGIGTTQAQNGVYDLEDANGNLQLFLDAFDNIVSQTYAPTTSATDAFLYSGKVAGVPTGVPAHLTGFYAQATPIVYDSTDSRLYAYNGGWKNVADSVSLKGTTGSIGGSALVAGACATGTVTITGVTTAMGIVATPVTTPGPGFYESPPYVSATNTVTVSICAAVAGTPTASTYNVRVIP